MEYLMIIAILIIIASFGEFFKYLFLKDLHKVAPKTARKFENGIIPAGAGPSPVPGADNSFWDIKTAMVKNQIASTPRSYPEWHPSATKPQQKPKGRKPCTVKIYFDDETKPSMRYNCPSVASAGRILQMSVDTLRDKLRHDQGVTEITKENKNGTTRRIVIELI
jgi:hypothetical protein